MKHQILNKTLDLCAQLLCVLLPISIALYTYDDGGTYLLTYFTVGICQLVSFAANKSNTDKRYQSASRETYGFLLKLILIGAIVSVVSLITPVAMLAYLYLCVMLLGGVLMAVFYFIITIAELRKLIAVQSQLNKEL